MHHRTPWLIIVLAFMPFVGCVGQSSSNSGGEADVGIGGDASEEDVATDANDATEEAGADVDAVEDVSVEPSVRLLSPTDGAMVENPVEFRFEAEGVAAVQIEVDDWGLEAEPWDPSEQSSLTYDFNRIGYEREVALLGYDEAGDEVASDIIHITIEDPNAAKGDPLGTFWITYYYLAFEENYSGTDDTVLYGEGCTELTTVPSDYADAVCIEGSGKLEDGTVINYATSCNCGGACSICWAEMDDRFPWGQGSRGNALEPLRSWAVDTDVISHGTVLYVEEWDGVEIPEIDGLGGFTHDGCFRADDVGGGIDGNHFDFFAGTPDMRSALEQVYPTRSEFTVYVNSERCSL